MTVEPVRDDELVTEEAARLRYARDLQRVVVERLARKHRDARSVLVVLEEALATLEGRRSDG